MSEPHHRINNICGLICGLIHEGVGDWVEAIPLIELCVNNAVADSTGVSPDAFMFG